MKIGDSKVIDFNGINKRNIPIVLILMIFFIGTTTMIYHYGYDKGYKKGTTKITTTTTTDSYTSPSMTTEITATSKTNTSDPDLILNNRYHAVINGTDVQIPVKDKNIKKQLKDTPSSPSPSSYTSTTAHVDQTLDLTPLFKDYEKKRKWEMGIGVGRVSNEWYVPIEIQRNFGYDKGVSFQLNVKDNKVDGFQASYKIRF